MQLRETVASKSGRERHNQETGRNDKTDHTDDHNQEDGRIDNTDHVDDDHAGGGGGAYYDDDDDNGIIRGLIE